MTDLFSDIQKALKKYKPNPYNVKGCLTEEELLRKVRCLPDSESELEDALSKVCWHEYRDLDFIERTKLFVEAFDQVAVAYVQKNSKLSDEQRERISKTKTYVGLWEKEAPWRAYAGKKFLTSFKWKSWVKARREADAVGIKYLDYCAGAFWAANKRKWRRTPNFANLASDKLLGKADDLPWTIQSYIQNKYASSMMLVDQGYVDTPEYFAHVYNELKRVCPGLPGLENQKAKRMYLSLISQKKLPENVKMEF